MEQSRQRSEVWLLAASALLAVALGGAIPRFGAESLAQVPGDNVLALVLGDARQQVSVLLFDKVEEYFHGGVRDVDCPLGMAGGKPVQEPERAKAAEAAAPASVAADPWAWLNARVHAQEHRHLEDEQAAELLPWVWASCRASPKNIEAFQAGSYVLARMVNRPEEGVRLLEEGVRKNPECAELDFSLGEMLLNRVRDPARAEPWFVSALAKARPAAGKAGEDAVSLKLRALFYLGYLAKQRGELERLRGFAREAEALDPEHVCTKDLRALVRAAEANK